MIQFKVITVNTSKKADSNFTGSELKKTEYTSLQFNVIIKVNFEHHKTPFKWQVNIHSIYFGLT